MELSEQALAKVRELVQAEYDTWAEEGDDPALDELAREVGVEVDES